MCRDKSESDIITSNNSFNINDKELNKTVGTAMLPRPKTPSELLLCITNYVNMLDDIKGLNTLSKETLLAADEVLTRGQGFIRKSISDVKRKEEAQLQLHFSVRNAFYGVAKACGENNDTMLTKAKGVALSVGKQLSLPDIENYVNSLELEYKNGVNKPAAVSNAGKDTTAKYRIAIDGKTVSEKCRRNNMELARILYKHGLTEGGKSSDCKALGIDITDINNLNDPVEYRIKRKHLKIERIK